MPFALATALLACTAQAASAAAPAVTTGGAAVTPSTATFTGTVDPQGLSTTYWFEYGTTTALGSRTPTTGAGAGNGRVTAAGSAANLAANTVYHYRVVAHNRSGTTRGARKTVRTQRAPLGLSISAAPNPVTFGSLATIGGVLSGTGNAGRQVQVLQNPFPYIAGFTPIGPPVTTTPQGTFALPIGALPQTTQFRARLVADANVTSDILILPVAAKVTTGATVGKRRRHGVRVVRFAGRVIPARNGALYAIQRRSRDGTRWVTVGGGNLRPYDPQSSHYAKRIRVRHSGTYRVFAQISDGALVSAAGREVTITLKRAR
jgi:peptidoglycan hydrolase-like protein with peptidoglycan-binding domain